MTFGGLSARVHGGDVAIAVTGADARPSLDRIPFGLNSVRYVRDGQVIALDAPLHGLRSYLAVRGGIDATPTLGSRSHDVLSGLGPPPLTPGDVVTVGEHPRDFPELDQAPVAPIGDDLVDLAVVPGPRDGWFTDPDALVRTDWVASDRSDRVGMRLTGIPLEPRWPDRQLPERGRRPRLDPGAAQRITRHPRPRPSGDGRLSGDRRRGGSRRRPRRSGAARAARAAALDAAASSCPTGRVSLVGTRCAAHRASGPHL